MTGAPTGRPPRINPDEVVTIAYQLFDEFGYAGTTMQNIAQAAGISRKALFLHFPSKSDLIWHRAEPYVRTFACDLDTSTGDISNIVSAAILAGLHAGHPDVDTFAALVRLHATDPDVYEVVEHRGEDWRGALSDWLESHGVAPLVADVVAYTYWRAMWRGMRAWHHGPGPLEEAVAHALRGATMLACALLDAEVPSAGHPTDGGRHLRD